MDTSGKYEPIKMHPLRSLNILVPINLRLRRIRLHSSGLSLALQRHKQLVVANLQNANSKIHALLPPPPLRLIPNSFIEH